MSNNPWVDPRVASVRAAGVQAYLSARGWKRVPFPGPELLVFEGPPDDDGQPITQVVPASEHLRDFRLRVEELIGALSVLEGRPPGDVLTDMVMAGSAAPPPLSGTEPKDAGTPVRSG
jgi:hypothetical protein